MPKIDKIIVTTDSQPRTWTVVEVPGSYEISIGWVHDELDTEVVPPLQVQDVLVEVLAATGSVIYGRPEGEGPGAHRVAELTGYEFNGFFGMFGPKIELVWTDQPETMKLMFDTGYMTWSHEGQFAIIYKAKSPPTVSKNALLEVVKHSDFGTANLKNSGALGSLVPGADGEFAHFIFYNQADRDACLEAMETACKSKNLSFQKISGQQFEETNWYVTAGTNS